MIELIRERLRLEFWGHYGEDPKHLGQYWDYKTGKWIDMPDELTPLFKVPKSTMINKDGLLVGAGS